MEISLPHDKAQRVHAACDKLLAAEKPLIRQVAQVIGSLVACFPAVSHGKLHYRNLELDKVEALAQAKGRYDKSMSLRPRSIQDLRWWSGFLGSPQPRQLVLPPISKVILTDASDNGWGGG